MYHGSQLSASKANMEPLGREPTEGLSIRETIHVKPLFSMVLEKRLKYSQAKKQSDLW